MLFSSPGAELPDVYLSESVIFLDETSKSSNNKKTYTVVLTHPPGMREDETVRTHRDRAKTGHRPVSCFICAHVCELARMHCHRLTWTMMRCVSI